MTVAAATAIAPRLRVRPRDAAGETEALLALAAWCGQFTPNVALEFPDTVLLEVSASLTLFKGLAPVLAALQQGFAQMNYSVQLACAPTPLAASWLARAGGQGTPVRADAEPGRNIEARPEPVEAALVPCDKPVRPSTGSGRTDVVTGEMLAKLPVALIDPQGGWRDAFDKMGLATMGDLLAQPREGLTQRFGHALCERLDQALGRVADPRIWFVPPECFAANLELPAEVSQAEALVFAARRLLVQLGGFLQARAAGVQRFSLHLAHRERATDIVIGLVSPSRDAEHFTLLLRERLGATVLSEPVRAMRLAAADIQPLAGESQALFAGLGLGAGSGTNGEKGDWQRLVERLRARLGSERVSGLALASEHRPERASVKAEPGAKPMTLSFGDRPLWLLPEPRPLPEFGAAPRYEGPLALIAGPERIESGWWDDAGIKRDYFVARTQASSYVWIYRERQPAGGWYLHGLFA